MEPEPNPLNYSTGEDPGVQKIRRLRRAGLQEVIFGFVITLISLPYVLNQWFGEPVDVGAPCCAPLIAFFGPGLFAFGVIKLRAAKAAASATISAVEKTNIVD